MVGGREPGSLHECDTQSSRRQARRASAECGGARGWEAALREAGAGVGEGRRLARDLGTWDHNWETKGKRMEFCGHLLGTGYLIYICLFDPQNRWAA